MTAYGFGDNGQREMEKYLTEIDERKQARKKQLDAVYYRRSVIYKNYFKKKSEVTKRQDRP